MRADWKKTLEERIYSAYQLIKEYEEILERETDPTRRMDARGYIERYNKLIGHSIRKYLSTCSKLDIAPAEDIFELAKYLDLAEEIETNSSTYQIPQVDSELGGCKIISIGISQIFKLTDLVVTDIQTNNTGLFSTLTNTNSFRRALNTKSSFSVPELGSLKPVTKISEKFNRFWGAGIPRLKYLSDDFLCFIPFELSLTDQLKTLSKKRKHIFDETFLRNYPEFDEIVSNLQLSGNIRVYPPGVGIIKINLTLEFSKCIMVDFVAKLARNIEHLLFIDPESNVKPIEGFFIDIIDKISSYIFVESTYELADRRWLPPSTTFTIKGSKEFNLESHASEVGYLLALAPANTENEYHLLKRIRKSLRRKTWTRNKIFSVTGEGVSIFYCSPEYASGNNSLIRKAEKWFIEANELVRLQSI